MAEKTFEEALNSLQKSANEISKQATSLEDSIKLFESGLDDAKFCKKILDEAEQKISVYEKGEDNA